MGFFDKLKNGLNKTKDSINEKMNDVFSNFRKVDEELLEELEEILIMSDIGVNTSVRIINILRNKIKKEKIETEEDVRNALKEIMREICDAGGAIFFSTHVLDTAEKLCDKVAIIKNGKLIKEGTMEEVKGDESLEEAFLELEKENA